MWPKAHWGLFITVQGGPTCCFPGVNSDSTVSPEFSYRKHCSTHPPTWVESSHMTVCLREMHGVIVWRSDQTLEPWFSNVVGHITSCGNPHVLMPWLVWLSGFGAGLWTKGSLVQFPVRAHVWAVDQVPSRGRVRGNHTLMFLSLSFSLHSPLSKKPPPTHGNTTHPRQHQP